MFVVTCDRFRQRRFVGGSCGSLPSGGLWAVTQDLHGPPAAKLSGEWGGGGARELGS